jgi:hypothetical protein
MHSATAAAPLAALISDAGLVFVRVAWGKVVACYAANSYGLSI